MRALTDSEEHRILAGYARDRIVLEIGSYDGASALAMAATAKQVHCIDPFREDRGTLGKIGPSVFRFLSNTDEIEKIILHKGRSIDILPFWKNGSFGFVFVDGAHDSVNAIIDIGYSIKLLRKGDCFAVHDYTWPTIEGALRMFSSQYVKVEQYAGRLLVCRLV